MLILRDMIEEDIEDYVFWFTKDIEWCNWDSPWEPIDCNEENERREWTNYFEAVKNLPADRVRRKYEIISDDIHIGWICSYTDLGYLGNEEKIPAIGIDIPEVKYRRNGNGTSAFKMYIDYLLDKGYRSFYTQTWSGNYQMVRLAEKLGFKEICRKKDYREVDGRKYDAITFRLDVQ